MKKVLLVVSIITMFLSCDKGSQKVDGDVINLSMIYAMDTTDSSQVDRWDMLVQRFNELYPNIVLDVEFLYSEVYHNKLMAMGVADQLPDLMFLWPGKRTAQLTNNGLIKDISSRVEPYKKQFSSIAVLPQGNNGEFYELPETVNVTHIMYANEKILKELGLEYPKTMDELMDQGSVIREAGYIPISMSNGDGWQMQSCFLSALVERTGGLEWYQRAVKGDRASFTDKEFVDALTIIKDLYDNKMFTPGINQATYGQETTDFVNEDAVYLIDGGWRVNNFVSEFTSEQKKYITLNTFPEIENQKGKKGSTAAVAGTGFGMNSKLKGAEEEAAWNWIWFFGGPEGAKIRQETGAVPAVKVESDIEMDIMVERLTKFIEVTPTGYVLDSVLDAEGMGILQTGLQEMMLGAKTPIEIATEYEEWVAANDSGRK